MRQSAAAVSVRRTDGDRPARRSIAARVAVAAILLVAAGAGTVSAAKPDDPRVKEAIDRGTEFIARMSGSADPGRADMGAVGMLKAGRAADDAAIVGIIEGRLLPKFSDKGYKPHNPVFLYYEASADLMLLANTHSDRYRPQVKILAELLIDKQHPEGYWDYPPQFPNGNQGDTSMTQYALLGLWDAARDGFPVPASVWDRAAGWQLSTQEEDGSFRYHPGNSQFPPTNSMVAAGVANLLVCRLNLYGEANFARRPSGKNQTRSSVLTKVIIEPNSRDKKGAVRAAAKTSRTAIDAAARRGISWLDRNWRARQVDFYHFYYFYSLERACALAGTHTVGSHNWYDELSEQMLTAQRPDGSWGEPDMVDEELYKLSGGRHPHAFDLCNTAFAILFLSRATTKVVGEPTLGGGWMIGGRGLPSNLASVQTSADGIRVRKLDAPVDDLLAELENPKSVAVEAVQEAIVENVQAGDREKLIGQKDRLKRLVRDRRVEVRRIALWALGRCATVDDASILVKALDDPDLSVVVEANNALCWLSRRPNGFGKPADPYAEVSETASEKEKEDAAKKWRTQIRSEWREWFNKIAPYSQRELPLDLP